MNQACTLYSSTCPQASANKVDGNIDGHSGTTNVQMLGRGLNKAKVFGLDGK